MPGVTGRIYMSEILYTAIAKAAKIKADEWIATLKTDGGEWLLDDEIAEKVSALFVEKVTAAKGDSYKNGQREINTQIKSAVKEIGFENPDGLQGKELLAAAFAWKEEQMVPPTGDTPVDQLDAEAILKLPVVKNEILRVRQESGKGVDVIKKQFDDYKIQVEQESIKREKERAISVAERHTEEYARKGNIILKVEGVDEKVRLKSIFDVIRLNESIGLDAKGQPIILGDDGEQKKDEYGNPIPFSEIVVSYGKGMYGVSTIPQNHEGATLPTNQVNGGQPAFVPKYRLSSIADYDKLYTETGDPAERLEIAKSKAFHAEKAAGN